MISAIILIYVIFFNSFAFGANILAILPTPSYSHQVAYLHIWKELSLRGHSVTLITTDPLKDPKLVNLTEIDMSWLYIHSEGTSKDVMTQFTMWNMHELANQYMSQMSEVYLSYPDIQNLIHNKSHFDVVLVEFTFPEMLAFGEIYNCPKILFSTVDATGPIHQAIGNPMSPAIYPDIGTEYFGKLSFQERLVSTVYSWYLFYFYPYKSYTDRTRLVKKYFNISRTVNEMINDIDMLFISVNPIIQGVRALGPTTITIGGNRPALVSAALPEDIKEFLDGATNGFIYFSLGSNVKSKFLPEKSLEAIIDALKGIPFKVLWKFEADDLSNKPDNVKLIKWAPQQKVLSHPNIKLFITQGGLQSMEEGIYSEVPFVVIPFFADQFQNAKLLTSKGTAVIVNRQPFINKLELKTAILEVINNPKYKEAVVRLKHLALDSPMSGLEKAVWWTEYVIRNKGAKHLRNPAADTPFYQYYLLDVISFLILVGTITIFLAYITLRTTYRLVFLYVLKPTNKSGVNKKIN